VKNTKAERMLEDIIIDNLIVFSVDDDRRVSGNTKYGIRIRYIKNQMVIMIIETAVLECRIFCFGLCNLCIHSDTK
jgi:hypothetical protein